MLATTEEMIWFRQSDGIPILRFVKQGATTIAAYYASASNPSGINDTQLSKLIHIYPNPTEDFISVKSDNVLIGSSFTITDELGKQILIGKITNEITSVDVSQLAKGVYFFQVGQESKQTFKVVKR
ncbi:hypothetical protein BH10BAC1_BH10BAC1_13160 [soil metagenome]